MEGSPLLHSAPARGARRTTAARVAVVGALVVAAAVARGRGAARPAARLDLPRPPAANNGSSSAGALSGDAASKTSLSVIDVPLSAMLAFPKVVAFLARQGIADPVNASASDAGRERLLAYLPARLELELDTRAVAGSFGANAAGGYVAFNLYYEEVASWMVVASLRGELLQFAPALTADELGVGHFCGLKNYDEDTLLLVSNQNYTGSGHAYLWRWRDDAYTKLAGGRRIGTHDIQWSSVAGQDAFWAPGAIQGGAANNANVSLVHAGTGATLCLLYTSPSPRD